MTAALTRFRVMAYLVGVLLLVVVAIGMPLKYIGDNASVIETVGPVHGFFYVIYLLVALDLAVKCRWSVWSTLLVLISGAIPFLSFVMERRVTHRVKAAAATV